MATNNLTEQFAELQRRINLGGRMKIARAAHLEVASILEQDDHLREHGVSPVLIGSYARHTSIWPGKDVDIFGRLTEDDIASIDPAVAYGLFRDALSGYGDRVEEQPRSLKVTFGIGAGYPSRRYLEEVEAPAPLISSLGQIDFSFSVDVVPAARWGDGEAWGIPSRDTLLWQRPSPQERWVKTNPEALTALTRDLNAAILIHGQGAYVPTVKALKQVRKHHLAGMKPSFLYFEFMLYEGVSGGSIRGETWPDLTHSALGYLVARLSDVQRRPVTDPASKQPYLPTPTSEQVSHAIAALHTCRDHAAEALTADRCRAAYLWRQVFGRNGNEGHDSVFPLPAGCTADGTSVSTIVANPLRGGTEERGFGSF